MNTQLRIEKGRSMVEILGVLAIIAVLSVAGIKGYSFAMSRLKANEAFNHASIANVEITAASLQRRQGKISIDLPENSAVSVQNAGGYANVGLKVDFKNDISACKYFADMYANNSDFYVLNNCEE